MVMTADEECYEVLQALRIRLRKSIDEVKAVKNDVNRIFAEDWWPLSFLLAYHYDVDVTYAVIVECLKWRRSFCVDNISLLELKPLLDRGLAYIHGKDCNGSSILWINMRQHVIGQQNSDKLIIYWLERHTMELQAAPITLLFDMSSCCLQNMDLDLIKFIVRSCKYYYPSCLTSLLIFENPGLLKASWILLRTWMSPEMQRLLQYVRRSSLSAHVPLPYIPKRYGGQDSFIFTMDELARCIPQQSPSNEPINDDEQHTLQNDITDSGDVSSNSTTYFNKLGFKRSVTFEEEDTNRGTSLTSASQLVPSITKRNGLPQALRHLAETRLHTPAKDYAKVKFLSICPREELTLNYVNGENDMADIVVLKNESVRNVAYKIKITSPEKFRVRPSTGTIAPGATEFIRVYLQNEFRNSVPREKLLLMAVETSGESEVFGNVWKHSSDEAKIEHKLRCRLSTESGMTMSSAELMDSTVNGNENNLPTSTATLMKTLETRTVYRQNIIMISMAFIIVIQLLSLIWQHRHFTSILNIQKNFCSKFTSPSNNLFLDSEL
uniref:Major sperm protein n=1 Tax=Loa loa TaxID=7209 RepID=A0A1I7VTT2_LOALO